MGFTWHVNVLVRFAVVCRVPVLLPFLERMLKTKPTPPRTSITNLPLMTKKKKKNSKKRKADDLEASETSLETIAKTYGTVEGACRQRGVAASPRPPRPHGRPIGGWRIAAKRVLLFSRRYETCFSRE